MKKILVACAVGVNTSEIIASKIEENLEAEGFSDLVIDTARINDVQNLESEYDVIVSLANIENTSKPIVNGVPLLTGNDVETVMNKIKKYL